MLSTLRNAWKVPELRKKFCWTIFLVAIFRMGTHIPVPGINAEFISRIQEMTQSGLLGFYDLISGGAFSNFSILALGVTPYINASIIMQLLTIAIPSLEQLSKEGQEGRKKIQNATRYVAIVIAVILAIGSVASFGSQGAMISSSSLELVIVIMSLVVGSTFCIWLGDQITVKGFGNGTSILIFVNIISRLPLTVSKVLSLEVDKVALALFIVAVIALLVISIFFSLAERKIPVQYAGKAVGNKVMKGQSTHIPLSIISAAVIAIIFAMSVMGFPKAIAQFFPNSSVSQWIIGSSYSIFNEKTWMYPVIFALLTVFFTWFYNEVTLKPDEMAENLNKSAGFVPGIRPGEQTTEYFEKILARVSIIGGVFAAFLAVTPILVEQYTPFKGIQFGATAVLIVIGVAMDFSRQLQSQMVMRHYEGFLK
ncbi:preprotein translocase subunit SecY [Clostridium paraputrificum]|uniref:preprotein translocase subunit SecY n=1 Tax=Clostridium paraputrificum TaxID=29363 RepID=UPI00189CF62B|nr:preprotein translocase subunit SecY [Clostridium paraputrificum]MDB2093578.1 preprotein translocase subunit SecY [Clostridium paraputrificum]